MSAASFHRPDPIEVELRPRSDGRARRMARLSDRDARAWHDLAGRLVGLIEGRLGPNVVANRIRTDGSRWGVDGLGASLRRLRARVGSLTRSDSGAEVLLTTDVEEFFPSVMPDALGRALPSVGVHRRDAAAAAAMLEGWASLGYPGLPIGPPASAVLANLVLCSVDAAVGAPFVRWVDDYLVAATTERRAAEVLERMDHALARLGLTRSARKTVVGEDGGWLGFSLGSSGTSAVAPRPP